MFHSYKPRDIHASDVTPESLMALTPYTPSLLPLTVRVNNGKRFHIYYNKYRNTKCQCSIIASITVFSFASRLVRTIILCLSELYKFNRIIMSRTDFSDQFRKVIMRNKRISHNLNVMRRSVCLLINPILVTDFAELFNCT